MSSLLELRKVSLSFRRVSSNLLNTDRDSADVCLTRFLKFIDDTPEISKIIHSAIDGIDYDFNNCFGINDYGRDCKIPVDEKEHLKAQYDFAHSIADDEKDNVLKEAFKVYRSPNSDKVREFISDYFKPMIDYINDAISTEMIILEESESKMNPSIIQHIGANYGTMNTQGTGSIVTTNNTNVVLNDINSLLSKILPSIDAIEDISDDDKESITDDLESIKEQVNAKEPKKSRLQKALANIKKFAGDFSMKLAVSLAVGAVTKVDWNLLIQNVEQFISQIAH